jgi:hypothetical protein
MHRASSPWVRSYRLIAGVVILLTILAIFTLSVNGSGSSLTLLNFFTIQSNLIAAAVFLWLAALPPTATTVRRADVIRGAAVLYLAITGIVFALLLSAASAQMTGAMVWINAILHQVAPLVVFLDWLIVPPAPGLTFRHALLWLVYPIAYVIYTLIRGFYVDWYPYPFLTPSVVGGYGGVAVYVLSITIGVVVFAALLVAVGAG